MKKPNTGTNLNNSSQQSKQINERIPFIPILWIRINPATGDHHATFALACLIELFYFPN